MNLVLTFLSWVAVVASLDAPAGPVPAGSAAAGPAAGPSLTLAQAEQNALAHQPSIRQAGGQTEAAEGRVEEARAGYLPQVTATGSYQRTTGNFAVRPGQTVQPNANTPAPGVVWTPDFNYWSFGLAGSQLIYDFNATADRWRAAGAGRDAAAANQQGTTQQALLAVRRAYFQAEAQRDLRRVAEDNLTNQQKHLDQIQAFVKAGMRSEIDLATARTALANARVQMVNAQNAEAAAMAILNQTMGMTDDQTFALTDNDVPPVDGEDGAARTLVERALHARPEIAAAQQQQRAQELQLAAVRGNYGPAISAAAGLTEAGRELGNLTPNWFVGLNASWALLQGGLTTGQLREAKGTLTAMTAQADAVRLQVTVDVEQGRLAVRAAKANITATQEALAGAKEQLRLAEGRYRNGQGSVIELADAQVAYTSAAAQEVSARYSLASARAQLLAALGVR